MADESRDLLQTAERLFREKKLEEAAQYYNEAGVLFRNRKDSIQAAHCFSQAAFCEKLRVGLEPLLEAAGWSEMAAQEALKARQFGLARKQFREAGLIYEREGEFGRYSHCFVQSQDAFLQYLFHVFLKGEKQNRQNAFQNEPASLLDRLSSLAGALMGVFSKYLWGYGENPWSLCGFVACLLLACAFIYDHSGLVAYHGAVSPLDFKDALYMSGTTFSTLGYGDYVPLGWVRAVSFVESLSGFLMVPLFVVSLTRRYLRVYR